MITEKNNIYETWVLRGNEKNNKKQNGYAGGVFYELARTVIEKQGTVVGAAYAENFQVIHIEVDDINQIEKITGVKYPESYVEKRLKEDIKSKLQAGKMILFAGTPCQVEDLYQYLGDDTCFYEAGNFKPIKYEKLYTVAVGCSGVIQPEVWEDYIAETQSCGSVITEICCPYRGEFGITQKKILIKFSHGRAYFRDEKEDKLLRLKNSGFIYKEDCYHCQWRLEKVHADLLLEIYYDTSYISQDSSNQEKGLTQVSVCSEKGKSLMKSAFPEIHFDKKALSVKKRSILGAVKPKEHDYFWKYYQGYGFSFASNLLISKMDSWAKRETQGKFLEKYALLDARGITIDRILDNWGLKKVILYGQDTICGIVADKMKGSGRIISQMEQHLPILVSPLCFMPDVMEEHKREGISRKWLVSLQMLIDWEYDSRILGGTCHSSWKDAKYLITGAQFANKGAQSMLFVTVNELRRKHPDCDIYYLPVDSSEHYPDSILAKYRFHIIRDGQGFYSQLYSLISQITAIVDVSGYALSSAWNCSHFIHILLLAKNNQIPIYYMPQSFGALDFTEEWGKRIGEGLAHASVIFARERAGYDRLVGTYHLKNCRVSTDLVLQNKEIALSNIYTEAPKGDEFRMKTDSNVAIVPNTRNYESGNKHELLKIYERMITELTKRNKNVYLVSHSDDGEACRDIYRIFSGNDHVFLYQKPMDCLEFGLLSEEFQYMIASRYHGIVHAYKEGVPCLAIGWAEKYKELLSLFGQEGYLFDVRTAIDTDQVMEALCRMDEAWRREKDRILNKLPLLQTENCFDVIE